MLAFAVGGNVCYALVRADAKRQLRIGSKPNAERSGGWPMSIIEHVYSLEVSEC
jgi:hypothetical protein